CTYVPHSACYRSCYASDRVYHSLFFFQCIRAHLDLHSFPTRRSSDLIYPFQIFSWKRFVLKGTSISIGSRRFGVSEIREMRLLSDKKLIYIYVTYTDNPFKLRVDKRNYKGLTDALDMFCTRYDIPFKEQW